MLKEKEVVEIVGSSYRHANNISKDTQNKEKAPKNWPNYKKSIEKWNKLTPQLSGIWAPCDGCKFNRPRLYARSFFLSPEGEDNDGFNAVVEMTNNATFVAKITENKMLRIFSDFEKAIHWVEEQYNLFAAKENMEPVKSIFRHYLEPSFFPDYQSQIDQWDSIVPKLDEPDHGGFIWKEDKGSKSKRPKLRLMTKHNKSTYYTIQMTSDSSFICKRGKTKTFHRKLQSAIDFAEDQINR